jgi:hypothetical protein
MSIDNHTGVENTAKQHPLDFIRENLKDIPESMTDEDCIDKIVNDISLTDVYNYMTQIKDNQDLPLKRVTIDYAIIFSEDPRFTPICKHCGINNVKYPPNEKQRIYFIQSSDFATVLIPIDLGDAKLNIYMEALDCSPEIIKEIWAEVEDGEKELQRELQKEEIAFIKRHRKKDLALKEPWEI